MKPRAIQPSEASAMWQLAQDLAPVYRTLVSPGFEASLNIIRKQLPIKIKKYASGTRVFDWTIPKSWSVREAYLEDMKGRRLFDFKDHPLFVGPYSIPFSGVVSRDELRQHLHSLPHLPQAFPLCPSYYVRDWHLGVPHAFKENLKDKEYRVHIDSEAVDGHLCIGELFLPGRSQKEILISSYLCHPVMANDNLSGVVVAVELFKRLAALKNRRYSYRLIIIPETIGSITYLYHHQKQMSKVAGAFNLTCCGDRGGITVKKTWHGNSLVDRACARALRERPGSGVLKEYYLSGSDERQFNAPGFRIPMATVMRTPPSDFLEYHSSNDNFDCITPESLLDTLDFMTEALFIIDHEDVYCPTYKTEPFLTGYGIFKQVRVGKYGVFFKEGKGVDPGYLNQAIIHETDGGQSLLDIAEKYDCPFRQLVDACAPFIEAGLIVPRKKTGVQ